MTSKIRILDEQTINQIAAGEVIENPASVVKELIENAIDAKATSIVIEIEGSGHQMIRIQDNGSGMSKEDANLCFERHATSKVVTFADLYALSTMGFRGEALPSIASISEFFLLTCPNLGNGNELKEAYAVTVKGGKVFSSETTKALPGTCVEVRSLFYNVPARRKFQKSGSKDALDIIRAVSQAAIAYPEIAFDLVVNEKKIFSVKESSLENFKERVEAILGIPSTELISIHTSVLGIDIVGSIIPANKSFPNRVQQYLFVNRRPITSLMLSFAVKNAYGPLLETNRHPGFQLQLFFPPDAVDVNVHPQKREVRFQNEELMRKAVTEAVSQALFPRMKVVVTESRIEKKNEHYAFPKVTFTDFLKHKDSDLFQGEKEEESFAKSPSYSDLELPEQVSFFQFIGVYSEWIFVSINWSEELQAVAPKELLPEGYILIHTKLALSRIAYEDLLAEGERQNKIVESQHLLVPVFIDLELNEAKYIEQFIPYLSNFGFSIKEFGKQSYLIESVPSHFSHLSQEQIKAFIKEISYKGFSDVTWSNGQILNSVRSIAQIASKSYVNNRLSEELGKKIVKRLLQCRDPFHCPFGAPTCMLQKKEDLLKQFNR